MKMAVNNIEQHFRFQHLTSVQKEAKMHKGSLFIVSPTGSGKTEAALLWLKEICK